MQKWKVIKAHALATFFVWCAIITNQIHIAVIIADVTNIVNIPYGDGGANTLFRSQSFKDI